MADNYTRSIEQVNHVRLRVMVDRERNKVVYAEAGKDFVDALLSFLTLPLGTIARLVAKQSNIEAVTVGSLSSLYLWTHACKEMLLKPRNSMEVYSQNLKLNIDDTEPMKYFLCQNRSCFSSNRSGFLSTFRNQNCSCGRVMDRVVIPDSGLIQANGSDDLYVMLNVIGTSVRLLQDLGVRNIQAIQERTYLISVK
jgi:hypothetical protein